MELVRSSLVAAFVVGLVGCASAPKPELPDSTYAQLGTDWVATQKCAVEGLITADTAAQRRGQFHAYLGKFTHDSQRVARSIASAERTVAVDRAYCTELAIQVATRTRQIQNQNAATEQFRAENQRIIDSTKSKQTYCNRIGTQTFCNSY